MNSTQVLLNNVRLSFPHITMPSAFSTEQAKYSADFILPANHPDFAKFWEVVQSLAVEKWKENGANMVATLQTSNKVCFGDGNTKIKQSTGEIYGGYVGNWYIGAKCLDRPQLMDINNQPILDPTKWEQMARQLYGGCRVNAVVKPYLQVKDGNGIRGELVALQFAGDDEPFGEGTIDATPMFANAQGAIPTISMVQQAPVGQVPVGQVPVGQTPNYGTPPVPPSGQPVGQVPVGQTPVGQVPVGQVPVGQVPVGQTPVGQVPVGQVPVGQTPVGQVPVPPSGQPVGIDPNQVPF